MSEPKHHHFAPRFYLRRFADESEQISVRVRSGDQYTTSTRSVIARMGLCRVPGRPLTAEHTLGNFEAHAAAAIEEVCTSGQLPGPGTDARRALALFMALQLSRSPDTADRLELAHAIKEATGSDIIAHGEMQRYLEKQVLGFPPRATEVQAACDFVNYSAPNLAAEGVLFRGLLDCH